MTKLNIFLIILFYSGISKATTWNEPWRKEIIKTADYFVSGQVITNQDSLITIHIFKNLGASKVNDTITVDNFYMLDLCSYSSGNEPSFHFDVGDTAYWLLKRNKDNNFSLPTPSSGYDKIYDKEVSATFRHSYHQALISQETYELAYQNIWNHYHDGTVNSNSLINFINENLALDVAGFDQTELPIFFRQHVALESIYLLDLDYNFNTLAKFVRSDNFHAKISGLRAMEHSTTPGVEEYLYQYIMDDDNDEFTVVIAITSLWNMKETDYQNKLWRNRSKVSKESPEFGGDLMDPRICTYIPSPQSTIQKLHAEE